MARLPRGVALTAKPAPAHARVITPDALSFVAELARAFESERQSLLARRAARQAQLAKGERPDFLSGTSAIRTGQWRACALPPDLQDRRVEVTGPVDRKTVIRALNAGGKVYVADFEDATAPTLTALLEGQRNLMDRWTSAMEFTDPASGKRYALSQRLAALMVRPRGLHMAEAHMQVDGKTVSASLFDAGLYLFHNARTAVAKGSGPYLSLPKLESHQEARWWNSVFVLAQSLLGLPLGTIKATVLIETVTAGFEMDEIIYELRDHVAALAMDPADYAASALKMLHHPGASPETLSALAIKTCHRRGCLAIGPRAAAVPNRKDAAAHDAVAAHLRAAKEAEARNGFDGTAVAHPDMVAAALAAFNDLMPTPNQLYVSRDDVTVGQKELLESSEMPCSEAGLRSTIRLAVSYFAAWLEGRGSVVIDGAAATAAEAEQARALLWHWLATESKLREGGKLTRAHFDKLFADEVKQMREDAEGEAAKSALKEPASALKQLVTATQPEPYFTSLLYKKLS